MNDFVIQGIGILGMACFIISYQIKSNKALYMIQTTGTSLFCIQFMMLGAWSGCFNLIMIILRNVMLTNYNKYKWIQWKGWVLVISAICTAILIFTWDGPLSLLPFIALVGSTIGYWTNNAQKIRLSNLVCASPAWVVYDIFVGSIGGMLSESITIISILVSIYRYGWKTMGDPGFGNEGTDGKGGKAA